MASPRFYEQVRARLTDCDLLVLEGVQGKSFRIGMLTLAYRLAPRRKRNGLMLQDYQSLIPEGVPVLCPDVTAEEVVADLKTMGWWSYVLLLTLAPLMGAVFALRGPRAFLNRASVDEELPPAPGTGTPTPAVLDHPVDRVLLDVRDARLLDTLGDIHARRCGESITVAVVYGAEHIPAVVVGLMDRHGYRPEGSEWLTVLVA